MVQSNSVFWVGVFLGCGFAVGVGTAFLSWMVFNEAVTWLKAQGQVRMIIKDCQITGGFIDGGGKNEFNDSNRCSALLFPPGIYDVSSIDLKRFQCLLNAGHSGPHRAADTSTEGQK